MCIARSYLRIHRRIINSSCNAEKGVNGDRCSAKLMPKSVQY